MFFGFTNSKFPNALPSEARVRFLVAKGASRSNKNLGSSRECPKCEAKIVVPTVG